MTGTKKLTLQGSKRTDQDGYRQLASAMDGISIQDCAQGGNMETLGLDFGNVAAASASEIRGAERSPHALDKISAWFWQGKGKSWAQAQQQGEEDRQDCEVCRDCAV